MLVWKRKGDPYEKQCNIKVHMTRIKIGKGPVFTLRELGDE